VCTAVSCEKLSAGGTVSPKGLIRYRRLWSFSLLTVFIICEVLLGCSRYVGRPGGSWMGSQLQCTTGYKVDSPKMGSQIIYRAAWIENDVPGYSYGQS